MSAPADHLAIEALRLHQPTGVRAGDIRDLRSKRDRKRAVKQMRKTWGPNAARSLEQLQDAQIELGHLLAIDSPDAAAQREVVMERRRALDRDIETRRAETGGNVASVPAGRDILNRLFGS